MRLASLALLAAFMLAGSVSGGEPIAPKTLHDLKRATVYLRVKGVHSGTGSGFVIHTHEKISYIITNSHVVSPPTDGLTPAAIEAVFSPGTADEKAHKAELVASLPEEDLALLRVRADGLPPPLTLSDRDAVETAVVYSLGFPLGERLGEDDASPAVTISKGSVSSLRRDSFGAMKYIQLDDALNPGNSGGPVVDRDGQVIGVAVKAVLGTRIGLAIPAAEVAKILQGRPLNTRMVAVKTDEKAAEIALTVSLIDPFQRLRTVTAHYVREDATAKVRYGQSAPLTGAAKVELTIKDQVASGVARLPETKPGSYWLQIGCAGADGKERLHAVLAFRLDDTGRLLLERPLPLGADKIVKKGFMVVNFTLADAGLRTNLIEHIKIRVGNPIIRHNTFTSGKQVSLELAPVNEPREFLNRLLEIGTITRIRGQEIDFTPTDLPAIAKMPPLERRPGQGTTARIPAKDLPRPPIVKKNPIPRAKEAPGGAAMVPDWTMDLNRMEFPDRPASGRLLGADFKVEAATVNKLTLKLGEDDAGIIIFHGLGSADVAGKSIDLAPGQPGGSVHLRQKNPGEGLPQATASLPGKRALRLVFGEKQDDGTIPGRIYLCLSEDRQTVVAGTFTIRPK